MIGQTLRQYTITGHLGQGGMGEVWLARDTTLGREVALKVLPVSLLDTSNRKERFFREAKAASALNHPNIVTIYEINSDQGIDFIAMEYVEGHTLAAILARGPLPIDRVERYATQMAAAVGRAHRANIVHRDLKPGNIMVTDDGLVKVLDFGIAKMTQPIADASAETVLSDSPRPVALTREGTTIGTLGYMSPEQAIGDPVDARSDVFSFGIILYEMLAGRLPFTGKTRSEVLRQMHQAHPTAIETLRADTPDRLRDIVERCLQTNIEDRYPNLTDVASAMIEIEKPFDSRAGTSARPLAQDRPATEKPERAWRRIPFIFRAAIVILIVSLFGPIRTRLQTMISGTPPPTAGASRDAGSTSDMTREAGELLTRQDRDGNADRAIALLEKVLAADQKSAIAYAYLSSAYLRKQQTNPDPQWMKLARESAQRAVDLNPDLAAAHLAMGFLHVQAGERAAATAAFSRAAELDPVNPMPHVGLGTNFDADHKDAEAEAAFRKGIELGPQEWRAHSEFGQFCYRRARYAEAATLWEAALKITPDNALMLRNLGAVYFQLGRPDQAASSLQRALEVRPSAPIYTNLGTIRFYQGRYNDAVAAFEKAVEQSANNALYWANLGDGLRWAPGRRNEAAAAYRRALELLKDQIAEKPRDADLQTRRAMYLMKMGDKYAAQAELTLLSGRTDLTAQMWYRITIVQELAGERAKALTALENALKAGYSVKDLGNEPELTSMRADVRYHRVLDSVSAKP